MTQQQGGDRPKTQPAEHDALDRDDTTNLGTDEPIREGSEPDPNPDKAGRWKTPYGGQKVEDETGGLEKGGDDAGDEEKAPEEVDPEGRWKTPYGGEKTG